MNLDKPILVSSSRKGWQSVSIKECNEELIPLSKYTSDRIDIEPRYFLDGHKGALKEMYARKKVCDLLNKAAEMLPKGYKFLLWDVWRPVEVQKSLFKMAFKNFKKDKKRWGNMSDKELKQYIADNCVSLPSVDPTCPSQHSTGGSVDLTIIDSSNKVIPTGTGFDEFSPNVITRYYEEKLEKGETLIEEEKIYLKNRRMLYNVMIAVGFTNYSDEWWHYDYGNQFWGRITSNNAIYGKGQLK